MMDAFEIVARFKLFCGIHRDKDASEIIGISETNFNNQKKRGSIVEKILDWAVHRNVDLNWLITGEGNMTRSSGMEKKPDQGQAMQMLLDIFSSTDSEAKEAIFANLKYFSGQVRKAAVDRRQTINPNWPAEKERRNAGGANAPQG